MARARQALGSRRFAVAWKAGVESGLDDAVEYADQADVVAPSTVRPAIPADPLTRREREVAGLVASGLTNKVIAERLVISERTVDGHVANVLGKLVLRSRAQVAVWAVEHNLAPTSA